MSDHMFAQQAWAIGNVQQCKQQYQCPERADRPCRGAGREHGGGKVEKDTWDGLCLTGQPRISLQLRPRMHGAHSPVHDTPRISTPPTTGGQGIQLIEEDNAGSSCPGSGKHWEKTARKVRKSWRSTQWQQNPLHPQQGRAVDGNQLPTASPSPAATDWRVQWEQGLAAPSTMAPEAQLSLRGCCPIRNTRDKSDRSRESRKAAARQGTDCRRLLGSHPC